MMAAENKNAFWADRLLESQKQKKKPKKKTPQNKPKKWTNKSFTMGNQRNSSQACAKLEIIQFSTNKLEELKTISCGRSF